MGEANPIADQVAAAAEDAARRFETAVNAMRGHYENQTPGRVVATATLRFMESLRSGDGRKCEHIGNSPMVVFGAACNPGIIGCAKCINELAEMRHLHDQSDGLGRTCDGCGHKAAAGKTGMVQHGPLLLQMSLCPSCCEYDEQTPIHDEKKDG